MKRKKMFKTQKLQKIKPNKGYKGRQRRGKKEGGRKDSIPAC